jgi:hypothetical protein
MCSATVPSVRCFSVSLMRAMLRLTPFQKPSDSWVSSSRCEVRRRTSCSAASFSMSSTARALVPCTPPTRSTTSRTMSSRSLLNQ